MQRQFSSPARVVTSMVQACAVGLLLWACSSSAPPPPEEVTLSYSCNAAPADLAACSVDTDCSTVAVGCYCGAQPVNGVARKYATTARSCEETSASACALGCASELALMTQDGTKAKVGTTVAARCDHAAGAAGTCKSYVPAPSGSDDPPTGW
jgi:hypothetical protein